jgi:hypothetical protein
MSDEQHTIENPLSYEQFNFNRARVLCSYDAKDNSELNLIANEVVFLKKFFGF